jgi:hypothetical protein
MAIRYIKKFTDVTQMDILFKKYWAIDMAVDTCIPLTDSRELLMTLRQEREDLLAEALFLDAIEDPAVEAAQHDGDYENSRYME